ncbi:hypothetical protein WM24_23670 [Burkholderia ubonensis]|uniref:hypothetical protein n=1 Tax=Burkholderia ubonensis TaxID=101571 RepID=UPI000756B699|nr:hypothetical protein [Burkholderia ubonensis]KWN80838.1 hypothetical protein WM24_23670 [Burkholderia ubonensis]
MTENRIFNGPALVVIDVETKTYARYFGNKRTLAARGEEFLTPVEVEMFRVDPRKFMGIEAA